MGWNPWTLGTCLYAPGTNRPSPPKENPSPPENFIPVFFPSRSYENCRTHRTFSSECCLARCSCSLCRCIASSHEARGVMALEHTGAQIPARKAAFVWLEAWSSCLTPASGRHHVRLRHDNHVRPRLAAHGSLEAARASRQLPPTSPATSTAFPRHMPQRALGLGWGRTSTMPLQRIHPPC